MRIGVLLLATALVAGTGSDNIKTLTSSSWASINNYRQDIDYKVDFKEDRERAIKETGGSDRDESSLWDKEILQNLSGLSVEKSYLITNNIISRKVSIELNPISGVVKRYENVDNDPTDSKDEDPMGTSDLWMALFKTKYGVLESRTLRFNTVSMRNGKSVTGTIKGYFGEWTDKETKIYNRLDGNFNKGDYWLYKAPDVYELYFYELLNKGIMQEHEFDGEFGKYLLSDYEKISKGIGLPNWWNKSTQATESVSNSLGRSYSYNGNQIVRVANKYFSTETMYTLDALKVVERFLRATEKDMTKLEADIVSYKYGINYLNTVNDSDKDTIQFLVAKGILNFEEPSELVNIYGEFTNEIAYKILYRVANEKARLDFSEVSLTDNQSYWREQGFVEDVIQLYEVNSIPNIYEDYEEQEEIDGDGDSSGIFKFLGFLQPKVAHAATSNYIVEKFFDDEFSYYYKGNLIKDIYKDRTLERSVYSIKKTTRNVNGTKKSGILASFSIVAEDQASAMLFVDTNITVKLSKKGVPLKGVTRVNRGDETITLIPASDIKSSWKEIDIVEDKVLRNNETGVMAVLLPDAGYALVGNEVIVSDKLMEVMINGTVYYNLDVIISLLPNYLLVQLSTGTELFSTDKLKEDSYKLYGSKAQMLGKAYVTKLNNGSKSVPFYNVNSISRATNTLVRRFDYKSPNNEKYNKITVIVDWAYAVPSIGSFYADEWYEDLKGSPSTLQSVTNKLYSRPTKEPNLAVWWDSNIGMSNALCNFIYGTSGIEYVKSGYLAPSVKVLVEGKVVGEMGPLLQEFFSFYEFKIEKKYEEYSKYTSYFFWETYFRKFSSGNSTVRAMAKEYRTWEVLTGKKVNTQTGESVGKLFGKEIFVSNSGVIYRDVYTLPEVTVSNASKYIRFDTRRAKDCIVKIGDTIFEPKTKTKWLFLGLDNGFIKLLPDFEDKSNKWATGYPLPFEYGGKVQVSLTDESITNFYLKGVYSIPNMGFSDDIITLLTDSFRLTNGKENSQWVYENYFPGVMINKANSTSMGDIFTVHENSSLLVEGSYYLYENTVALYEEKKFVLYDANNLSNNILNSTVKSIPIIYLPAGDFYISDDDPTHDNVLVSGSTLIALATSNVYYTGISQMVIDNIIGKYVKVSSIKDLPNGSEIYIGDTLWYKNDEYVETIIKDPLIIKAAKSEDKKEIKKEIMKLFEGIGVLVDNELLSLTNYFKDYGIGGRLSKDNENGIVYSDKGKFKVFKNNKSLELKESAQEVSIRMKISEDIFIRPINPNDNVYTVVLSSNLSLVSITEDLPFFSESLAYVNGSYNAYDFSETDYKSSVQVTLIGEDFQKQHKKNLMDSIVEFIKVLLLAFSLYFMVVGWAVMMFMKIGGIRVIVEKLSLRDTVGRKGIDVLRLLTWGIFNLDMDITVLKCCALSFVAVCVGYIANTYL